MDDVIPFGVAFFTPENEQLEPKNHPIEKENYLNQTSILGGSTCELSRVSKTKQTQTPFEIGVRHLSEHREIGVGVDMIR